MLALQDLFKSKPSAARMQWALARPKPSPQPARTPFSPFAPRRQRAASEHLFFAVRSLAAGGGRHVLQYGFADDRGNVVLSVFGQTATSLGAGDATLPDDLAVEPLAAEPLRALITAVCAGASLVTFHKVLQAGLLPAGAVDGAASVDCAWRRYLRLSRRRRRFDRAEPVTLDDALSTAGVGVVGAPDAALRALGVRELWAWMDRVE
jgi:hypothetical protein